MRCNFCHQRVELINGHCPVCSLKPFKVVKDFSKDEKNIRTKLIGIFFIAYLHLFIALVPTSLLYFIEVWPKNLAISLGVLNIFIWFLLTKLSLLGYRIAIAFYFCFGMVSVVTIQRSNYGENAIGIIICLLAIYLLANQTSRSIFERSLLGS